MDMQDLSIFSLKITPALDRPSAIELMNIIEAVNQQDQIKPLRRLTGRLPVLCLSFGLDEVFNLYPSENEDQRGLFSRRRAAPRTNARYLSDLSTATPDKQR